MIAALTNHLWQTTLFAGAVALLAVAFRENRPHVRYWLWFSASLKFLLPFSLLIDLGSHLGWAPAAQKIATAMTGPVVAFTMEQLAQPFPVASAPAPVAVGTDVDWTLVALFVTWMAGLVAIGLVRLGMWRRIRVAVRASVPAGIPGVAIPAMVEMRSAPGVIEPGVVGMWRPILLLPAGIEAHLTPPQLEAVVAHEICHVRRRDNSTSAIHMIIEAVFWFHPVVWWIGARLLEERERACDEEVLRAFGAPHVYAEGILNVCKRYVETPLICVSGVSGSNLKKRIEAIMANRVGVRLTVARKMAVTVAGVVTLAAPLVAGMMSAPVVLTQSAFAAAPADRSDAANADTAQSTAAFDVASVKPCKSADATGGAGGRSGGGGRFFTRSPGRIAVTCMTVSSLIQISTASENDDTLLNDSGGPFDPQRIRGGPAWVYSDWYSIEARTDDPVANGPTSSGSPADRILRGTMLRTLLETRFQLKTHRDVEEVPMYALTIAKGGVKLKPLAEGACAPGGPPPLDPSGKPTCGWTGWGVKGPNRTLEGAGVSLGRLAGDLGDVFIDHHVIDRTGITGLFNVHLEYAPDEHTPASLPGGRDVDRASEIPAGPSILTALEQQLGLKLEPIKGPHGFIVIDHVERPSEN